MFQAAKKLDCVEISLIRQMNALAKPDTINLGIGQLPYAPPPQVIQAGVEALQQGKVQYTANAGLPELRTLVAEYHNKKTGKSYNENNVIITIGVEQALFITFASLLNPGDEVLLPSIAFSAYETLATIEQAVPVFFNVHEDFSLDIDDLASKITAKTKLIVINSPSNPTGAVLPAENLQALAAIMEKHEHLYAISDEVYSELFFGETAPASLGKWTDRCIIVDGISKRASATGLRIGWTVADDAVSKALLKMQQYSVTCATSVAQYAAIPVLQGKCIEQEEFYRSLLRSNRSILSETLQKIFPEYQAPDGAFYCFPKTEKYGPSRHLAEQILEQTNVLVIPGIAFGEAADGYLRISYATKEDLIKDACTRLTTFFTKLTQ